jgi:diguanylate cyclase (GGDEF)-like protein
MRGAPTGRCSKSSTISLELPICNCVISLKKHIEMQPGEILSSTVESYRTALAAMGNCWAQACPPLSEPLRKILLGLRNQIGVEAASQVVTEAGQRIEKELERWGARAAEYYRKQAGDVKEIMMVLASTAENAGERDQRYSAQLHKITARLQGIAGLEDFTVMRQSLIHSANELKSSVEQMTRESQDSLHNLRAELAGYERRLQEADGLAMRDELTGLDNRRGLEARMEARVAQQRQFSLLVLDLNGFKAVNDSFGHLAGDQLLKQFALELRSAVRSTDLVARWGGDEFVVAIDGAQAATHVERITQWIFGDYTIQAAGASRTIKVGAAIGLAVWSHGETVADVFSRADAAMYGEKRARTSKDVYLGAGPRTTWTSTSG